LDQQQRIEGIQNKLPQFDGITSCIRPKGRILPQFGKNEKDRVQQQGQKVQARKSSDEGRGSHSSRFLTHGLVSVGQDMNGQLAGAIEARGHSARASTG